MEPQAQQRFTDADLIAIANDSRTTAQDIARLTPDEQQRFIALRRSTPEPVSGARSIFGSVVDTAEGLGRGAVKGAGETVFNLGSLMKGAPSDILIPGLSAVTGKKTLGDIANVVGPEGTNAEQAFSQLPPELEAQGGAENVGKIIEQVMEFFLPSGKVGPTASAAADLVMKMPKGASTARKALTDTIWKGAPMVDDAIGAGAVSMAHGDENPEYAMGASAGTNLAGQGVAQLTKLLQNPVIRQIFAILAGGAAAQGAGTLTGGNLVGIGSSGLGTYAVARNLAGRAASNPGRLMWAAENAGRRGAATAAGATDVTRRRSRDKEQ